MNMLCSASLSVRIHPVWWLLWGVFVSGLVGCGDAGSPAMVTVDKQHKPSAAAKPAAPKPRIALVMKTLTNPFFLEVEKGARRAESELDIELLVKTAAQETSIEQQMLIIDDLISARVDAIVITPGDSQRLIPVLKKAAAAGIKLVNIDNRLDTEALRLAGMAGVAFVGVDNEKAAHAAASWMARGVRPGTQAAIIEGIRSAHNAHERMVGAKRAFSENKAVRLVASETAHWKIDEGYQVAKQLFARHPDITLLFAANDMMALGTLKYLQESRRSTVKVAGYDALAEAVAEVQAGRLAVTVDQQATEQGFQGVMLAARLIRGDAVPEVTLIETRLVTVNQFTK